MDIVKNLICLEKDQASVIRFRSDKLEFIKKDGEIDFPITIDFWDWWKKVVSYVDGDEVDLCFVYDKNYDLLQNDEILTNNVINSEKSSWKIEHIKSYFWELKPTYVNLLIVGPEQQECPLGQKNDVTSKRFQTNLDFKVLNVQNKTSKTSTTSTTSKTSKVAEETISVDDSDYTEFAKFFVDLIRRERG